MYKIVLLVLTIIIASSNAQLSTRRPRTIVPGTGEPVTGATDIGSQNICICRINNTICSEPGCSAGDNLNCDSFRGNIFYSVYDSVNNYYRNLSACACPHYQGDDGYENANYIDDDAVYAYNYTTCDNIATADSSVPAPSDVAMNAANCCKYCCSSDAGVGGD